MFICRTWCLLYTLHKPARIHFSRNRVFVPRSLNQFQADLCNMQTLVQHNDDYHYLLMVTDVYSKKAFVRCLKRKTAEVVQAFKSIFKESRTPVKLQTGVGKEFLNKGFQALMKKHITHFTTASNLTALVVERFNCTLKAEFGNILWLTALCITWTFCKRW